MGSAIAISLALDYPEHVLGLGLVGAGARLRVNPVLLESAASPTTFYSAVETVVQWAFSPQAPEQLTSLATRRMAETRPSVLHSDFIACAAFDETERIAAIHQPTLVICGQDDKMTPLRYSQFLADTIPNAELEVIPEAGHMVMLEKPLAVATALANFLDDIVY
jgi:pimeloyl-ACP methyl ester carboxylesterase